MNGATVKKESQFKVDDSMQTASKKRKVCGYRGYTLPEDGCTLDVVDCSGGMDAPAFYAQYVSQRKPCILTNLSMIPSASSIVHELLKSDIVVQVERRQSQTDRFGQSRSDDRQVNMSVKSFARECCGCRLTGDSMKDDNKVSSSSLHYLSKQESPSDIDIRMTETGPPPPFFGPPCDMLRLAEILPDGIPLAGKLVIQSCNLWMGATVDNTGKSSANSGLHHDFHDNFYLLLAGRKEFRLYAPADAPCMAVSGDIDTIHPNGLISYSSNPIRADGLPLERVHGRKPQTINQHQEDGKDFDSADEEDVEEEMVFGKGFDYQRADEEEDEEDMVFGKGFDYQSSDEEGADAKTAVATVDTDDYKNSEDEDARSSTDDSLPNHFSWINPASAPKEKIAETFPIFSRRRECVVQLQARQCLYLPASWFHCVTSCGASNKDCCKMESNGKITNVDVIIPSSVHMAINYWYYPPDNLSNFEHPYHNEEYWGKLAAKAL